MRKRIIIACLVFALLPAVFVFCCFKIEGLSGIKSAFAYFGIGQLEDGDYYMAQGHISRLDYPINDRMLEHAAGRFTYVYENYLKDSRTEVYFSIIPDKNYFLAAESGYQSYDYGELVSGMREKTDFMQYIDIFPLLSADDYYRTDSHWRQEKILPVADALLEAMGSDGSADGYISNALPQAFKGVYAGEIALPVKAETLYYLTSPVLDECIVTSYNTGMPQPAEMYSMEKAAGSDAYELFLSGNDALITVENPNAASDRELVIFRDSFGSSIAPLFVQSYAKITLVDLRYLNPDMLSRFLEFDSQDVLFLYSTMLLNNSLALR